MESMRTKGMIYVEALVETLQDNFIGQVRAFLEDNDIIPGEMTKTVKDDVYGIVEWSMNFSSSSSSQPFDEKLLINVNEGLRNICYVQSGFKIRFEYVSFDREYERLYKEKVVQSHAPGWTFIRYQQLSHEELQATGDDLTDEFALYARDAVLQLGDATQLKRFLGNYADGISENALEAYSYEMDGRFLFRSEIPEAVEHMSHI